MRALVLMLLLALLAPVYRARHLTLVSGGKELCSQFLIMETTYELISHLLFKISERTVCGEVSEGEMKVID